MQQRHLHEILALDCGIPCRSEEPDANSDGEARGRQNMGRGTICQKHGFRVDREENDPVRFPIQTLHPDP